MVGPGEDEQAMGFDTFLENVEQSRRTNILALPGRDFVEALSRINIVRNQPLQGHMRTIHKCLPTHCPMGNSRDYPTLFVYNCGNCDNYSAQTKNNLEVHKLVCKGKDPKVKTEKLFICEYRTCGSAYTSFSASVDPICPGTPGIFTCRIFLTASGIISWDKVLQRFFHDLSFLKEQPFQEEIFQEQKLLGDNDFNFGQKESIRDFTTRISNNMQTGIRAEWFLSNRSRFFDKALIEQAWKCLHPTNFRLTVVSPTFQMKLDRTEKWYGTKYAYQKLSPEFRAEVYQTWNSPPNPTYQLPLPNEFISKLELKRGDSSMEPKIIKSSLAVRTWYQGNFKEPRAHVFVHLRNKALNATAESNAKTVLYLELVKNAIEECDPRRARMKYSMTSHSTGLIICVRGGDKVLPCFMERLFTTLRHLELEECRFQTVKERLLTMLQNSKTREPWIQAYFLAKWLVGEIDYNSLQTATELSSLTAMGVQQFFANVFENVHIEIFAHGNLYEEEALEWTRLIEQVLKPRARGEWPSTRLLAFPPGANFLYSKTLKRALYDELRTKQQNGYAVFSEARMNSTTMSFRVAVEGNGTPQQLEEKIENFLAGFVKSITKADYVNRFKKHKQSLVASHTEKPKNSKEQSKLNWKYIKKGSFDFEGRPSDGNVVKSLAISDISAFCNHFIMPSSTKRAKVVIHLKASTTIKTDADVQAEVITDVMDFKSKIPLAADPQPVRAIDMFGKH